MYFEARGEGPTAMMAVGEVAINRLENPRWPNDICEVAHQPRQFSYTHDGLSDDPKQHINNSIDAQAYEIAKVIAKELLIDGSRLGLSSTHFHTRDVAPYWSHIYERDGMIGRHVFYTAKKNQ